MDEVCVLAREILASGRDHENRGSTEMFMDVMSGVGSIVLGLKHNEMACVLARNPFCKQPEA